MNTSDLRNLWIQARTRAATVHAAKFAALMTPAGHGQAAELIAAAERASESALALHRMWWAKVKANA